MWWRMVFKEILRRKWGFLFSALAVAIAIGAWTMVDTIAASMGDHVRVLTKNMGQNILIVPASVSEDRYYLGDFGDQYLPEWVIDALLDSRTVVVVDPQPDPQRKGPRIQVLDKAAVATQPAAGPEARRTRQYRLPDLADHYLAELQARLTARASGRSMEVILTGQRQEEGRKSHSPIRVPPPRGQVYVGSAVAARLGVAENQTLHLGETEFRVARIEKTQGTADDVRVYAALADAQKLLGQPGKVNRVLALSCLCEMLTIGDIASILELHIRQMSQRNQELIAVRVTPMTRMAAARDNLRRLISQVAGVLAPVLGLLCAALVGVYFYLNVRERQQEIGLMLAIGYTPGPIVAALVLKLALIGLAGWAGGLVGGIKLAGWLAPSLDLPRVIGSWHLWPHTLAAAMGLTLLAGIVPVVLAGRTEPAEILRNA